MSSTNNYFLPNHPPLLQHHPHHLPPPLFNCTHHRSTPLHKPISACSFRPHMANIQRHITSLMDKWQQGNKQWTMSRWARWLPSCSLFFDTTNTGWQTNHMDNDEWMMRLTNSDDGWKRCGTSSRWWQHWASSLHALWAPKFPPLSVYQHLPV